MGRLNRGITVGETWLVIAIACNKESKWEGRRERERQDIPLEANREDRFGRVKKIHRQILRGDKHLKERRERGEGVVRLSQKFWSLRDRRCV